MIIFNYFIIKELIFTENKIGLENEIDKIEIFYYKFWEVQNERLKKFEKLK